MVETAGFSRLKKLWKNLNMYTSNENNKMDSRSVKNQGFTSLRFTIPLFFFLKMFLKTNTK